MNDYKLKVIKNIQILRGVAAWLVVFHHIQQLIFNNNIGNEFLHDLLFRFSFGVDIFFIISGFIIYTSASKPHIKNIDFIKNRILRVVPLYWACTLAAMLICYLSPGLFYYNQASLEPAIKSLLFIPYKNELLNLYLPFLPVGWTLNYEMVFYACVYLSMCIPFGGLLSKLLAIIISIYVISYLFVGEDGFYSNNVIFEFIIGSFLGLIYQKGYISVTPRYLLIIFSIIFLICLYSVNVDHDAIKVGIPCAIIVSLILKIDDVKLKTTISQFLFKLGNISYSTYLWHIIVLFILNRIMIDYNVNSSLIAMISILLTYKISELSSNFIEIPTSRAFRGKTAS